MPEPIKTSPAFRFGAFELDDRARELHKEGVRIRLQEQPFRLLQILLQRAGDVVTRAELRQKLWPSSVYVDFDHGLNNAIARLREVLGDAAGTPCFIETLPRVGYRFICPVVAESPPAVALNAIASEISDQHAVMPNQRADVARWSRRRPAFFAGLVAVSIVLGLLGYLWLTRQSVDEARTANAPRGPSIAVLPFVNLSGGEDNEVFADGLTEELVTKLAGIGGLKVVARTSSFRFKGKQ